MWQASFFDHLNLAIQAAKITVSTVKTYTDRLGRTYSVNLHSDTGTYSCSRDCDGFYVVPVCESLSCVYLLCDANGLTEVKAQEEAVVEAVEVEAPVAVEVESVVEAPAVVSEIKAVESIDAQIEALQAQIIALQAEKDEINASIDAQIAQGFNTTINGMSVFVQTHRTVNRFIIKDASGIQTIQVSSTNKATTRQIFKTIEMHNQISDLGTVLETEFDAFICCELESADVCVAVFKDTVAVGGKFQTEMSGAKQFKNLSEMIVWTDKYLTLAFNFLKEEGTLTAEDMVDLCLDAGCTEFDDVEEYDDHENGWKLWE
jgi:hypothetical protein